MRVALFSVLALIAAYIRDVGCPSHACLIVSHYFFFIGGLAAARLVAYAMATACFTGFPERTSVEMFLRKAALLGDLTRGITTSF